MGVHRVGESRRRRKVSTKNIKKGILENRPDICRLIVRRNKSIIAQFETHVPYTNRKSANLLDIHFFHAHPALPLSTPSFHDLSYFL